jgi:hypothetical protein
MVYQSAATGEPLDVSYTGKEEFRLKDEFSQLLDRLKRQDLSVTVRHLMQAKSALDRSEWEAANAQVRSALEGLFDGVAAIRLKSTKRGGEARRALENAGLFRKREAILVQEFMAVAGGAGSHPGVSNADESLGRFLIGLGIVYIGLALIPELMRVEDVLIGQLNAPEGTRLPTDQEIRTSCPTCGVEQMLSQAQIARDEQETVYTCVNGCQPIVVVGSPGDTAWEGRGYRLGPNVIRTAKDLFVPIVGSGKEVLLPASKAALMKRRSDGS